MIDVHAAASRLDAGSISAPVLAAELAGAVQPLPSLSDMEAFGRCFDRFGAARVVLLGEASHGTSEFYRARHAITRHLIEHHGFSIVAVEADWPDAARIDRYVRWKPEGDLQEEAFGRFPTWMWRNEEVEAFVAWLRAYNEERPAQQRASFRGLDVYSLRSSIASVLEYLDRVDPDEARQARERYGCLTPWQIDPIAYGRAVLTGGNPCEDEVVAQLQSLLDRQFEFSARDGEDFLNAAQNARTVRAAEQYYRMMYHGGNEAWNLRDRHMFETLQNLLAAGGPVAKAVVWAHNSHIGDASATEMGWRGQFNIGELCRKTYGADAALIGFGTDRGTVAAADDWGEPMRIKDVVPSRPDSYERVFRETGVPCSLTDIWRDRNPEARDLLSAARLERAIGVIYRPQTELQSHYFEAVLADQFDAYVWFERTQAIAPSGNPSGWAA